MMRHQSAISILNKQNFDMKLEKDTYSHRLLVVNRVVTPNFVGNTHFS